MIAPFGLSESSTQLLAQGWSLAIVSISRRQPPHLWLSWPAKPEEDEIESPEVCAFLTPAPLDLGPFETGPGLFQFSLISEASRRRLATRARARNVRGADGKPQQAQRFFSDLFHFSLEAQTHADSPRMAAVSLCVAHTLGPPPRGPERRRCLHRGERMRFKKSLRFVKAKKSKDAKQAARERLAERLLAGGARGNTEWASTLRAIKLSLRAEFPLARLESLAEPSADLLRQWSQSRGLLECGRFFLAVFERRALAGEIGSDGATVAERDCGKDGRSASGRRLNRI